MLGVFDAFEVRQQLKLECSEDWPGVDIPDSFAHILTASLGMAGNTPPKAWASQAFLSFHVTFCIWLRFLHSTVALESWDFLHGSLLTHE